MQLTARFTEALAYACQLHAAQYRKGSGVPYVAHLLSVAAIALEHGANEDEAIAALLHDAIEDQGGAPVRDEIGMARTPCSRKDRSSRMARRSRRTRSTLFRTTMTGTSWLRIS